MSDAVDLFYVYVDWTTEETPRRYYVGYGNRVRVRNKRRNKHHTNIRNTFGFRREIVANFADKTLAEQLEIRLIAEYKTYVYSDDYVWGCNYTKGGDGSRGHRQPPTTEEHRRILSAVNSHPKSVATKALMKIAAQKRASDPEWIKKMQDVAKKRWRDPAYIAKRVGMKYKKEHP